MAIDRKSAAIVTQGSGKAAAYECNSNGVAIGAAFELPIIKDSTLADKTEQTEVTDEGGDTYSTDSKRTVEVTHTYMQRDTDTIKMMVDTYRNKYLTIAKQGSKKTIDGNYQTFVIPICKVVPDVELTGSSNEIKATFKVQVLPSNVTVNLTTFNGMFDVNLTSASFLLSTNDYWDVYDQAAV